MKLTAIGNQVKTDGNYVLLREPFENKGSRNSFLLSSFLLSAFLLFCSSALFAQLTWSGTQTFNSNTTITQTITLTGNTTVNVAAGVSVYIQGIISESGGARTLTTNWQPPTLVKP